jgi:hypothetical protein
MRANICLSKNFEIVTASAGGLQPVRGGAIAPGHSRKKTQPSRKRLRREQTFRRLHALAGSIHRGCLRGDARPWPRGWSRLPVFGCGGKI